MKKKKTMKKFVFAMMVVCSVFGANAQDLQGISLNAPSKQCGTDVMTAFANRQSCRSYAGKELSLQQLSDLLWAANGVNRPEKGMRTAPSALNYQDVDIYVCTAKGAYLYDARAAALVPVTGEDLRNDVAKGQDFAAEAPVLLILVSDVAKMRGGDTPQNRLTGAIDAGIVSQNISIACAGMGLSTVPRMTMDKDSLARKLNLKATQVPFLNHPVGFAK